MVHKARIMNKGFVTTFILVLVLAFTMAAVFAVSVRTTNVVVRDRILRERAQAVVGVHACLEKGLNTLRNSPGASSGSISDSPIACTFETISGGGAVYTVYATSTYLGVSRSGFAVTSAVDPVALSAWTMKDSF